jgi:hypothetical protein
VRRSFTGVLMAAGALFASLRSSRSGRAGGGERLAGAIVLAGQRQHVFSCDMHALRAPPAQPVIADNGSAARR